MVVLEYDDKAKKGEKAMKKLFIFMLIAAFALFSAVAYAVDGDQITYDAWRISRDGDLLPVTTNTYDLGSASLYPAQIFLGGVGKASWGSVVSPWEDSGTTTTLTSAPTKFILTHSSGVSSFTGYIAGTADIVLENGQILDGGTGDEIIFTENGDSLSIAFSGNDIVLDSTDGGVIFTLTDASDGTVDLMTNNDSDDYIQVSTTTNQPLINFVGCNGKITAASGTIDFDDDNLTTTGTVSSGATTVTSLVMGDDVLDVVVDDQLRFASNDEESTIEAYGYEAKDGVLQLTADEGDDAGDKIQLVSDQATNSLLFTSDTSVKDTHATILTLAKTGLLTTTGDVVVAGTTPKITIGDGGAEDVIIAYNGVVDYYIANDDSADDLIIGLGSTVATTEFLTFKNDSFQILVGDASAADAGFTIDGNAVDFSFGIDDGVDSFSLSLGSALGTTEVFKADGTTLTITDKVIASGTLAVTGISTFSEAVVMGSEDVTTSSADPGLGTASIATLVTLVTTDATGSDADIVSLAAGDAGQLKIVKLVADTETTGMALAADYGGASTSILFEDADDLVLLVSDGTEWQIVLNTGGTVS